jgi:hypothetical protein
LTENTSLSITICSHEGGSLADGRLEGYEVEYLIRLGLDILRTINYKKD